MKDKLIHGAIAAVVAGGVTMAVPPKQVVTQVTHSISASKHAWPDLDDVQKADLAEGLRGLKAAKLDIMCGDGACTDLAQDIDDAAELAGIDSALDRPAGAIGYGLGVMAEEGDANADALAAVLSRVTGRQVTVTRGRTRGSGYPLWIAIGKLPRK